MAAYTFEFREGSTQTYRVLASSGAYAIVSWTVTAGSAQLGSDFTVSIASGSNVLVPASGQLDIVFNIIDDGFDEADEFFTFNVQVVAYNAADDMIFNNMNDQYTLIIPAYTDTCFVDLNRDGIAGPVELPFNEVYRTIADTADDLRLVGEQLLLARQLLDAQLDELDAIQDLARLGIAGTIIDQLSLGAKKWAEAVGKSIPKFIERLSTSIDLYDGVTEQEITAFIRASLDLAEDFVKAAPLLSLMTTAYDGFEDAGTLYVDASDAVRRIKNTQAQFAFLDEKFTALRADLDMLELCLPASQPQLLSVQSAGTSNSSSFTTQLINGEIFAPDFGVRLIRGSASADALSISYFTTPPRLGYDTDIVDAQDGNDVITFAPDFFDSFRLVVVNGGSGNDTLVLDADSSDFASFFTPDGIVALTPNTKVTVFVSTGGGFLPIEIVAEGPQILLLGVEQVVFRDRTLSFSEFGAAIQSVDGTANAEELFGSSGPDRMSGYDGADEIAAGYGNDRVEGGNGDDRIFGGAGDDALFGGENNDSLWGGPGRDSHDGGAGLDYVRYDEAARGDLVVDLAAPARNTGVAAGDTYFGIEGFILGTGNDYVFGDTSRNFLVGGAGNDVLRGAEGDDSLDGGTGDDIVDGGTGLDTALYLADSAGVATYLYDVRGFGGSIGSASFASGAIIGTDYLISIENVSGGAGADYLFGDFRDNRLNGNGANDFLRGLQGIDTVTGGDGSDLIIGDEGADILSGGSDRDIIDGGPDGDIILGEGGDDELYTGTGADTVDGGAGSDIIYMVDTLDSISGGSEKDYLVWNLATPANVVITQAMSIEWLQGRDANDTLNASGVSSIVEIQGHGGSDTLTAGSGGSILLGGSGRDRLIGGNGLDHFVGGTEADTFRIAPQGGTDYVYDFERGTDRIDMVGTVGGLGDLTLNTSYSASGWYGFGYGTGTLWVNTGAGGALSVGDFLFS